MVILDIDMGYGQMIREMTLSIWSFSVSIWDNLSLWMGICGALHPRPAARPAMRSLLSSPSLPPAVVGVSVVTAATASTVKPALPPAESLVAIEVCVASPAAALT
jgi:hypothetical protein